MIKITNLLKKYGDRTVLDIENLTVTDGETVAIIGPNGSGKSTLLKILGGIIRQSEGTISKPDSVLYLPQQSTPFDKTVVKNILFGAKGDKEKSKKKADALISELGLTGLRDKKATTLSGGELQKTALCRLLINNCELLLLDEPTAAADIEGAELIRKAIIKYREETGCTLIMTTHSPAEAKAMADRIIMLHDGKITEDSSPDNLFESPSTQWGKKFISQWKL